MLNQPPRSHHTYSLAGIKAKVETQEQYKQYLEALEGLRQELGVALREELYPNEQ
jgi:cytochrome c oxidase subunit 5a